MKTSTLTMRIALVALTALLALPVAQSASPVEARKRPRTVTRAFSNPTGMTLANASASPASAALYPSPIEVDRLKGKVRDVNLRRNGLTHTFPADVQVLPVEPRGQTAIVMADVGGSGDVANVKPTLDDEADAPTTETTLPGGTFRPTNLSGNVIAFNAPAPIVGASANTALSVFDGTNPIGTWRLFVQDDQAAFDPGLLAGGWDLEITTKARAKKKR